MLFYLLTSFYFIYLITDPGNSKKIYLKYDGRDARRKKCNFQTKHVVNKINGLLKYYKTICWVFL